jgi:hypothetical protein
MKARKTGLDPVELAVAFGSKLADKIASKYLVLYNKKLRSN